MSKFGSDQLNVFLVDGISLLGMKAKELSTEEEAVQEDTTGLGDAWTEFTPTGSRIARLSQGEAFYDAGTTLAHEVFRASQQVRRIVCYAFQGNGIGAPFYGHEGTFAAKYKVLAQNNNLTKAQTDYVMSGARDEGVILESPTPRTANWNTESTNVDNGVSTSDGGTAYQQVVAYSGFTDVTGAIRHSADDIVYTDLLTFTPVTGVEAQRQTVAGTVNRYLAFAGTVSGSGSIEVLAGFSRN